MQVYHTMILNSQFSVQFLDDFLIAADTMSMFTIGVAIWLERCFYEYI